MKINFEKRERGSNLKDIRLADKIPVVCYGSGEENSIFSIDTKELKKFMKSDVVLLDTTGDLEEKKVILKDVDYHPITDEPVHADFLFVNTKDKITTDVSLNIVGESPAEKLGANIIFVLQEIEIEAFPQDIPSSIDIDISNLQKIGDAIRVSDVNVSNDIKVLNNEDEVIVSCVSQEEENAEDDGRTIDDVEIAGKSKPKDEETEGDENKEE